MFTGLVQATCRVTRHDRSNSVDRLTIQWENHGLHDQNLGDSIAIDGVCLTLTKIQNDNLTFEIVSGTLAKTSFQEDSCNRIVNVEKSVKVGDHNGGHNVSGHVDFVGCIKRRIDVGDSASLSIEVPKNEIIYFFNQGFVALNGASITVFNVDKAHNLFDIWLIPETLSRTNLSLLQVGSKVNIEVDPLARIVVDGINHAVVNHLQAASDYNIGIISNDICRIAMMKIVSEREVQ